MERRGHLERAFSKAGLCSRAEARERIRRGEVTVNGRVETDPRRWVDLDGDVIRCGAAPRQVPAPPPPERRPVVVLLHKPRGVVVTRRDGQGRPTVDDVLPPEIDGRRLVPVGRLDLDSSGLLLLTDDGTLADRLTDPARHVPRVYLVRSNRFLAEDDMARFRAGMELDGRRTLPAGIEHLGHRRYRVTLAEGRNRQIRRLFRLLGCRVLSLARTAYGPIEDDALAPGEWRLLTDGEIDSLLKG